ncbi:MAG: branched-chain amino acid ABC transporter permease [Chloroflexi bacterium RBG_13_50_10]|nr:MAG: branched-chain amino acid ABC transporter permease [Chloroflexi bacterium RBG_13_50_10]
MDLPCGTRNYDYARDMAVLRTKTHWAFFIGLLVIVFTAPLYLGNYWLSVFNLIGITIITVTGLNILIGYCGQLSIGHAGFMAVGAYTTAILTSKLGFPFLAGLICSGFSAGLIGIIFGLPSVRVRGFYLAITTIAAQFIIIWIINHWSVTGGFVGMDVPRASIGGLVFKSEASQFYLIMVIVALCIFLAKNLARGRVGRAFIAVRDNDLAAEVMGINLLYYKLLAFFIGCFLAGIAGALYAHWTGFLNAENFTLTDSILYIGMVIIGGLGTTIGPIIGVVVIRLMQQGVTFISPFVENAIPALSTGFTTGLGPMVFGLAIILFLILEPRGLAHRWALFKAAYRLWPFSY